MTFKRRSGTSWVDPTTIKRRSGGAWVNVTSIKRRISGAWVTVWSLAHSVVCSPASINENRANSTSNTTRQVTAVVSGGIGPFTYAWSWQGGFSSGMTLSGTTSATVTINASGTNTLKEATLQCVVTDTGNGNTQKTTTCSVAIQFGTPL